MGVTILTDLYDRQYNEGHWDNSLKSGAERLSSPTISILGGTNESQFRDTFLQRDVKGGFLGRAILVAGKATKTLNPLLPETDGEDTELDISNIAQYFKRLSQLRGAFAIEKDARLFYRNWYMDFYTNNRDTNDETGTLRRMKEKVLKVAMLISLSMSHDMSIVTEHFEIALSLLEPTMRSALDISKQQGASVDAAKTSIFLAVLCRQPEYMITRAEWLRKHWNDLSADELDKVTNTLADAKIIAVKPNRQHGLDNVQTH